MTASEEPKPRIPTLLAHRAANGDVRVWCPYCGRFHTHGNLPADAPIGAADGHRVAHCVAEDSPYRDTGYYVTEVDGPAPEPPHQIPVRYERDGSIRSGYLRAQRKARP